jgi:hypothetical protein
MYAQNELLFPNYVIPGLRDVRSGEWRRLVDRVMSLPETHPENLAFMLMMVRMDGCLECETDSYRAMRGCGLCAAQTLRRFKGGDRELLASYQQALDDVLAHLEEQGQEAKIA